MPASGVSGQAHAQAEQLGSQVWHRRPSTATLPHMTRVAINPVPTPRSCWLQLCAVPVLLVAILLLDSERLATRFTDGQTLANLLTLGFFFWLLRATSPRLRRLMFIGIAVATVGEVVFSLLIGMYEYRLHNVPLYVPLGHAILYATVFRFIREPWVRRHAPQVILIFYTLAAVFSLGWLLSYNDVYGCLCFGAFSVLIFYKRESRLFFVTMYLLVAYLELIGTYFQCWAWPPFLLNKWPAIASANPPSGISVFYIGFDIACLGFYKLSIPRLRSRYRRMRSLRKAHGEIGSGELVSAR